MTYRWNFSDANQQALAFVRSQLSIQEPGFYQIQYPDLQYPSLVPVVSLGWEWASR
jgi:hypothetical protein